MRYSPYTRVVEDVYRKHFVTAEDGTEASALSRALAPVIIRHVATAVAGACIATVSETVVRTDVRT